MSFSFIPVQTEVADEFDDLFGNVENADIVLENADMKILIDLPQVVDVQDANETGVLVQTDTLKIHGIRLQLK